MAYTEAWK